MKLQNKKTGEICEFMIHKRIEDSKDGNPVYAPFNDSVEEWQDYEEPHTWWYINDRGYVVLNEGHFTSEGEKAVKSIGNKFEAEDEAEKAVEKLKAWTRLKDKGFKFVAYYNDDEYIKYKPSKDYPDMYEDLDLLFGGEE